MQLNLFPYEIVSLIISISQNLLAKWQGFTFVFIGNG